MKKRFILFMLLPAISLTASTDSFYGRVHALHNQRGTMLSHQTRKIVVPNSQRRVYNKNRMVRTRQTIRKIIPRFNNRTSRVKISTVDTRKFFYATRAAKSGNAKAQFDLAIMYATGRGVQKNEKIAFNWFHKSARKNYAAAKHYMGLSFLQGRGVRKQKELARYWFRLAVKQGYRASASYLSNIDVGRV